MKKLTLLAVIALTMSTGLNAALITTGDTITVNFDLTNDPGVEPGAKQAWFHITFTPFGNDVTLAVNPGEYLVGNWYENPGDNTSLQTDDYLKVENLDFNVYSWGNSFNGDGLTDYKGQLVFNDVVGDFEITSIAMRVWNQDGSFTPLVNQDFIINPVINTRSFSIATSAVPVPAAVWLFSSGLIGLVGVARVKKK